MSVTWSSVTGAAVSWMGMVPPEVMPLPPPGLSSTNMLPSRPLGRMVARVPWRRGAKRLSICMVTVAPAAPPSSGATLTAPTLPTGTPPSTTSLPGTSCEAERKYPVTSYGRMLL